MRAAFAWRIWRMHMVCPVFCCRLVNCVGWSLSTCNVTVYLCRWSSITVRYITCTKPIKKATAGCEYCTQYLLLTWLLFAKCLSCVEVKYNGSYCEVSDNKFDVFWLYKLKRNTLLLLVSLRLFGLIWGGQACSAGFLVLWRAHHCGPLWSI